MVETKEVKQFGCSKDSQRRKITKMKTWDTPIWNLNAHSASWSKVRNSWDLYKAITLPMTFPKGENMPSCNNSLLYDVYP